MTEVLSKTRACVLSFKQLLDRKPAWSSSIQTKHVTLTLCIIGRCCVRWLFCCLLFKLSAAENHEAVWLSKFMADVPA